MYHTRTEDVNIFSRSMGKYILFGHKLAFAIRAHWPCRHFLGQDITSDRIGSCYTETIAIDKLRELLT